MQRTLVWALVACGLCYGCDKNDSSEGGSSGSGTSSGASAAGQSGAAGDSQNGGAGTGNGGSSGGAGGVPDGDGGAASGRAGADSGGQASGNGNGGGGGGTQWPAWVAQCTPLRNALCGNCTTPECLVCIYGTDAELQSTGVSCDEDPRNYKEYCTCVSSGCPPLCREEWR